MTRAAPDPTLLLPKKADALRALLLAAWAAGHSSPRLSQWLQTHPRFGAHITDWQRAGVVRRRAKWTATVAMAVSAVRASGSSGSRRSGCSRGGLELVLRHWRGRLENGGDRRLFAHP